MCTQVNLTTLHHSLSFNAHQTIFMCCSMLGGELFTCIQERADNAFNERGENCLTLIIWQGLR